MQILCIQFLTRTPGQRQNTYSKFHLLLKRRALAARAALSRKKHCGKSFPRGGAHRREPVIYQATASFRGILSTNIQEGKLYQHHGRPGQAACRPQVTRQHELRAEKVQASP
jgi:hypothetical protein